MSKRLIEIIGDFFVVLFIILGLFGIFWIVERLLGNSPLFEQIVVLLFGIVLTGVMGALFSIGMKIGNISSELKNIGKGLSSLGGDFKELSKDFNNLSHDFHLQTKTISELSAKFDKHLSSHKTL